MSRSFAAGLPTTNHFSPITNHVSLRLADSPGSCPTKLFPAPKCFGVNASRLGLASDAAPQKPPITFHLVVANDMSGGQRL